MPVRIRFDATRLMIEILLSMLYVGLGIGAHFLLRGQNTQFGVPDTYTMGLTDMRTRKA